MIKFSGAPGRAANATVIDCTAQNLSSWQAGAVAVDPNSGRVVVIDTHAGAVYSVPPSGFGAGCSTYATLALASAYNNAQFLGVAVDPAGNVLLADNKANNVGVLNLTSGARPVF